MNRKSPSVLHYHKCQCQGPRLEGLGGFKISIQSVLGLTRLYIHSSARDVGILQLTSGGLDVVHGVAVHLEHLARLGLLLLVAADGEGVLGHLDQHEIPPLPFLPDGLAHGVHVTVTQQCYLPSN